MPKKKTTSTRKSASSVRVKRRSTASRKRQEFAADVGRYAVPAIVICVLLGVVGYLALAGYRVATASTFFELKRVEVAGNERTSADDIRRTVMAGAEKTGVWNADLSDIRAKIEKFPFVRSAAVSMALPGGIRVRLTEREPVAVVHLSYGDYLVDSEGTLLTPAKRDEPDFPIILQGWDEAKTEKAIPDNLARLKLYRKMLDEWKQFDLASRVKQIDLGNPREPTAVIEDSGRSITVVLNKDSIGKSLKTAIDAVAGKGAKVRSVDAEGVSPVIQYLDIEALK